MNRVEAVNVIYVHICIYVSVYYVDVHVYYKLPHIQLGSIVIIEDYPRLNAYMLFSYLYTKEFKTACIVTAEP